MIARKVNACPMACSRPTLSGDRRDSAHPSLTLRINGTTRTAEVDGDTPLLWVLRDDLGLTGTKFGCGAALCGACTVFVGDVPTRSCSLPVSAVRSGEITTARELGG